LVIERLTGHPLDKWFQESVARPLRAAPLLFAPVLTAAAHAELKIDLTRIAPTEYDTRRNILLCGEVHDENAAALGGVAGHAGVFGTADAVLSISDAWLQARRRKTSLLNSDLVTRFTTRRQGMYHSSWALGWDTPSVPSSSGKYFSAESFGHLGYTGTSLWVDPAKELEVVLLSNRVHPSRTNETIRDFRPRIHDLVIQECVG